MGWSKRFAIVASVVMVAASVPNRADGPPLIERREWIFFDALPPVHVRLLLPPEHLRRSADYFSAATAALVRFGEWYGPYPHSALTLVVAGWRDVAPEPDAAPRPGSGQAPRPSSGQAVVRTRWLSFSHSGVLETAVFDAIAQRFWEAATPLVTPEHEWLVEALSLYSSTRALSDVYADIGFEEPRFFDGFVPYVLGSVPLARGGVHRATRSTTTRVERNALAFSTLERHLGWGTLQAAVWQFVARSRTSAATPDELFALISETSGRDLTWFIDEAFGSTKVFDYGIETLESRRLDGGRYETVAVLRRFGDGVFSGTSRPRAHGFQSSGPIELVVTFASGDEVRERWDGRDASIRYVFESTSPATAAVVDPDRVLQLDDNPANNAWQAGAGSYAAAVWSARWLVWIEDLMITYSFFV